MRFLDYIQGLRKGKDANAIEQEALTDPFLSDAIDGYDSIEGDHYAHIVEIQSKVQEVRMPSKSKRVWRILVAAVAFFAVISSYFYLSDENNYTNLMSYITAIPEKNYSETQSEIAVNTTQPEHSEYKGEFEVASPLNIIEPSIATDDTVHSEINTEADISTSVRGAFAASADSSQVVSQDRISQSVEDVTNKTSVMSRSEARSRISPSVGEQPDKALRKAVVQDTPQTKSDKKSKDTPAGAKDEKEIASGKKKESKEKSKTSGVKDTGKDWLVGASANTTMDLAQIEEDRSKDTFADKKADKKSNSLSKISTPIIGQKEYNKYLKKNIKYPKKGKCSTTKGQVVLEFNITKSGRPINIKVIKSLCVDLDQEAIRLIRSGSDWTVSDTKVRYIIDFDAENTDK